MGDGASMEEGGGGFDDGGGGGVPSEYYPQPGPGYYPPQVGAYPAPVPVYPQPMPPQYMPQPQPQPEPVQYRQPPRRARKASKGEQRLRMVQYYEEVLNTPLFGDPNDPYANQVQEEVFAFVARRIEELFGDAPAKSSSGAFTPEEAGALKLLAQRMLAPDEGSDAVHSAAEAPPAAPAVLEPPQAAPVPVPAPAPRPVAQAPAPMPQRPPVPSIPPPRGAQVITRPTPAQRAALAARPPPRQQAPPPPQQPVQYIDPMMPMPVYAPPPPAAPQRGRRKKGAAMAAAPTQDPRWRPPLRYQMPQGQAMTAIMAMKASETIEAGGTVLSETIIRSAGKK